MQLIQSQNLVKIARLEKFGGESTAQVLMSLLRFNEINRIYSRHYSEQSFSFIHSVLKDIKVKYHVSLTGAQKIPAEGPFVIISNHPFGGLEGLILLDFILSKRPDLKILANFLLNSVQPVKQHIISVNPFETHRSAFSSYHGIRTAISHLENEHPLAVFPAGEVSTYQSHSGIIEDKTWDISVIRFIKKARVPVIPVFFHGSNSWLFHAMGKIHPFLRTAFIPSELLNKKNDEILLSIGNPIPVKIQNKFSDFDRYGKFLRAKTYLLESKYRFKKQSLKTVDLPIIEKKVDTDLLALEILDITPKFQLFQWQNYSVYCAPSLRIPNLTKEIGRLREITFREVGEGTNRSLDLDKFDPYYHQLFIWDNRQQKVVGGYRIGKGKDIYESLGMKGFYIHSLFRFHKDFHSVLSQSLELGRSFIIKEYQRKPLSLFMLWKGILTFLNMNTNYKYLIGPVSISDNYSDLSKELITDFIIRNYSDDCLAKLVKPRRPFLSNRFKDEISVLIENVSDINSFDLLIKDLDDTKMPVLLRKYLELGGKILRFNMDPDFNNCLDGLLLLDLSHIKKDIIDSLNAPLS